MYTKEEAEMKAAELLDSSRGAFCPLINGFCHTKCVCFVQVHVGDRTSYREALEDYESILSGKVFEVSGGYCACYMLHGSAE